MHKPINIEQTLEMVVLVLHDASEPAARFEFERLPVDILGTQERTCGSLERKPLTGKREAPLIVLLARKPGLDRHDPQLRIDRHPLCGRLILVVVHPNKYSLAHADLRGGEPYTGGCDGGFKHVIDERAERRIELGHRNCGPVEYGLTTNGDRENCHEDNLSVATRLVWPYTPPRRSHTVSNAPAEQIVWIDCEMTGLDPDADGLCEIAVIITDFDLTPLDPGFELVINPGEAALSQMGDFVRNMHETSGLLPRIIQGASPADAEAQVIEYVNRFVPEGRRPLVAGNTIGMDRRFIAKYMPALEERLHYRSIDVSTIKELARRWYTRPYYAAPEKRGGHRALADIAESIQELAFFRKTVFIEGPGPDSKESKAVARDIAQMYAPFIDGEPTPAVGE